MARDQAVKLYDANGVPVPPEQYRTSWDVGPSTPFVAPWGPAAPLDWAYPLAANRLIIPRSEEQVPSYAKLRYLAQWCDRVRVVLEHVKDRFRAQDLLFVPRAGSGAAARRSEQDEIDEATRWWQTPDRINDLSYSSWIVQLLEEIYVCDGVRIYLHPARGGDIYALRQIDCATMKPVLNSWGNIVRWQQVVRGIVKTDYAASEFLTEPYSPRIPSTYGTSHLEDVLQTVELAMRKIAYDLARFTLTNMPRSILLAPKDWTAEAVRNYQGYLDERAMGDGLKHQTRMMVMPGGEYVPLHPWQFDRELDESIVSLLCARFNVNRSLFVTDTNRANAEETGREQIEPGILAMRRYVCGIVDAVNARRGLNGIKATFGTTDRDRLKTAAERRIYVQMGALTAAEVRAELGRDPLPYLSDEFGLTAADLATGILSAPIVTVDEARQAVGLPPIGTAAGGDEFVDLSAGLGAGSAEEGEGGSTAGSGAAPRAGAGAEAEAEAQDETGGAGRADRARGDATRARAARHAAGRALLRAAGGTEFARRALRRRQFSKTTYVISTGAAKTTKKKRVLDARTKQKARKAIAAATRRYFDAIRPGVEKLIERRYDAETKKTRAARALHRGAIAKADTFDAEATETYRVEIGKQLASVWTGAAKDAASELDRTLDFDYYDTNASTYAGERAGELITRVDQTTVDNVRRAVKTGVEEGLALDELRDAILESETFSDARGTLIARTELAFAQNNGALSTYDELGVEKVHVFDGDDDEACIAANGQVWTIEEALENPLEHPNCERSFSPAAGENELE